ncbi:hypothetical protein PTI98_011416 [Pleurotus ostreatus]|uniref:Uncharacterized protein n=1 Tax=Pleurotus cornucopiae TaxID=5321 RepID=A0ACB7JD25_PLECO|nr:hypothetical protein CCMSSC00406_0000546 [Pleurotus cornucopiae]KAJ8691897.1 hypothetical protein PTI98_011416 [Pleurotus ostreatus]
MLQTSLASEGPYPESMQQQDDGFELDPSRFIVEWMPREEAFLITDRLTGLIHALDRLHLLNHNFNVIGWFLKQTLNTWKIITEDQDSSDLGQFFMIAENDDDPELVEFILRLIDGFQEIDAPKAPANEPPLEHLELFGQQVKAGTYAALQRNSVVTKDYSRMVPEPVTITVKINGQPARALIDSGSLGDFMSTTLVEQLGLKKIQLPTPLAVQLAVQGS